MYVNLPQQTSKVKVNDSKQLNLQKKSAFAITPLWQDEALIRSKLPKTRIFLGHFLLDDLKIIEEQDY